VGEGGLERRHLEQARYALANVNAE
jgi:hypothetical protein